MDIGTFTNHINNLGKQDFNILCRIVLRDILGKNAINVDGKGDGGADFIALGAEGERMAVAYQVTTQKSDIKRKAYMDAKKAVNKLGVNRFFFLSTYNLSSVEARQLEITISEDLGVYATVYTPSVLAEFIISHNMVRKFFELTGVLDGVNQSKESIDYLERALHTYTILSKDARNLKSQIYDDSLLFLLSDTEIGMKREELVSETMKLLQLPDSKISFLSGRVDSLMQKGALNKTGSDFLMLSPKMADEIYLRKTLYNSEQSTFYTAQKDLLKDYIESWSVDDSKQTSVWIANEIICRQISGLRSAGAKINNPLYKNTRTNGIEKLRRFLINQKKIRDTQVDEVMAKMVAMASSHPLIVKIVRASVYISLEGTSPLAAARSLGVNSWDEMNMLIEPTIGIPHICSLQYKGVVNAYFDNSISAIKRAKELGIKLKINYNYLKECAGHLLLARRYDGIDLNPAEMQMSRNAFVANYYALKMQKVPLPESFMDYLATFSPSIKVEHSDNKDWIREITTDIQSIFLQSGVEYLEMPPYKGEELDAINISYRGYLSSYYRKPEHLVYNDVVALKCVNERILKNNEHWMLLTYDNSLIKVSAENFNNAWINNPYCFLDLTELTRELPDNQFCSLVHSFAQYSERTLSIGARIIDRIVYYASENRQPWQFKVELEKFKKDMIEASLSPDDLDSKTDEFMRQCGIMMEDSASENEADMPYELTI